MPELYHANDQFLKVISQEVKKSSDFREKIGGSLVEPTLQEEFDYWKAYSNDRSKRIIMACNGQSVLGFFGLDEINLGARNARAHVHFWKLSKELPELCEKFREFCRTDLGLSNLWGMTNSNNKKAWNFALKMGFKEVGRLPKHYRNSQGFGDCIISNLDLTEEKK